MEEAAESSSAAAAAALVLALVALVVVPAVALLVRGRWRRAAARREEVRRLARLAAEESELAERESALAYYSELFPGVVHAAGAPEWGPPPVAVPVPAQEEFDAQPQPSVGAKGVCAVCFRPTTFRCKQCKAVKYCSFKCQIAHWRQGHKDECHPPSVNTRPDDEEEKAEVGKSAKENASVGVKQDAQMNKPAVGSETSDANHDLKSSNGKSKHMPSEAVCTSAEIPGGHKSNSTVEIDQNIQSVDSSKMGSSIKHANFVEDGSSTVDLNEALPCNSHSSSPNINGHSSFVNEEFCNHSKEHQRAKDASVVEDCSQTSSTRELEDSSIPHAAASVVLESKSSRTPIHVELERSKTKSAGNDSIQSTKPVPSALTVDKATSVRGSLSITPNNSSKVADSLPDRSFKPSDRSGSTTNNLATSLKKMVRQQTAPKVVRHYPSESTLFPYELFVKLYSKVELHPFGLHNLGNSCYANAVFQCLMFTRPLTTYLLEGLHSKNCSQNGWCFMCEFEKLIVEGKRRKIALSPTGILSHLNDIGSSFGPGKQEDAHEFLRYAIDAMQSVCMKEARKGGVLQSAEETTLVQLIFGGYLRSKIKCSRCHVSSEQCEPMLDLTVEIDGDISSLGEALVRFTSTEVLDGENKYHCSRFCYGS
ncbi:Ubiquitin carboxyl-terminal hydrolase 17 [Zea mays]|uniref:Ubiquitin carboxyl-terminal hydrolase 17 n=1 Tax=Zea mays TaxID=4577 RepID=A0A1D6KLH0_MAIZE|nr:Ubiquitin carboxyl-terminal hydrolase 17 [Zea mays]